MQVSADEVRLARTRWVQCKIRQAALSDDRGRKEDASRYAKEAEDFRQRYRLSPDISDYPQVSEADPPALSAIVPKDGQKSRVSDRQRRMITASSKGGVRPEEIAAELDLAIEDVQSILKKEVP